MGYEEAEEERDPDSREPRDHREQGEKSTVVAVVLTDIPVGGIGQASRETFPGRRVSVPRPECAGRGSMEPRSVGRQPSPG